MAREIMTHECDQCLMGKNRIVSGQTAARIISDTVEQDRAFLCHKGTVAGREIACRGHHERTGGGRLTRMAAAFGILDEIDPDTMLVVGKASRDLATAAKDPTP